MLKKQLLSIIGALAATCATAAPAIAADKAPATAAGNNFYAVFSVGRAKLDADTSAVDAYNLSSGFFQSATSSSTSATGGKAQLGYLLGKTFALEGGYTYLGKANFTSSTDLGAIGGSKEASLFNIDIVAKIPVDEKLSVLARFGGYYWKTKNEMANIVTLGNATINDNGYDFKVGAGLQYEFTPKFGMRGEFERFNGVGKSTITGDSKINQWTVGTVFKF